MQTRESVTSAGRSSTSRISLLPFSYEEGSLRNRAAGAPTLSYQLALPEGAQCAVLVLHGYGEHGGRYRRVVERFGKKKVASAVVDLRGHGWSEGVRGHCERFADYLEDAADMLATFKERVPELPMFVLGHSFGGLIAAHFALNMPGAFRGLVLSSPFFGLQLEVPGPKKLAGEIASRIFPRLSLPTGLSGADVTHDEAIARQYDNDPLVNKVATARWFTEAQGAQRDLLARAAQLKLPVLCVQAGADRVASAQASRAVFDRLGSADKRFDERNGLYHEVLNEPKVGMEIADEMADWMLAHAK
jgi:alpha-beta hydrolase superfamily lysophospholipase